MNDTDMTLDQILTIGGLGSGPYGGGDVVRWSPDGQELLVAAAIGAVVTRRGKPPARGMSHRPSSPPSAAAPSSS